MGCIRFKQLFLGFGVLSLTICLLSFFLTGCLKSTYPKDQARESILRILRKEYNIPLAQVIITGKTIHLYLPVEHLFTADLDDVKAYYFNFFGFPIKNVVLYWIAKTVSAPQNMYWESLARLYHLNFFRNFKLNGAQTRIEKKAIKRIQDAIELHPEVQDEIGQMLFAVARVARSTDLPLDFYIAQITDMRSGHEFILQGYLKDMNRLQMMDISLAEYHQRMLKDTQVNDRAIIHFPVRGFFLDLNQKTREEISQKYFSRAGTLDWMDRFYFRNAKESLAEVSQMTWEVEDVRSYLSPKKGRALVYVKVEVLPRDRRKAGDKIFHKEFLFETLVREKTVQIVRVIPFETLNKMAPTAKISESELRKNIKGWKSEFEPKQIVMEDYLSRQMMMRLYQDVYQDERIANTFVDLNFDVRFRRNSLREFVFELHPVLKDIQTSISGKSLFEHEDVFYLAEKFYKLAAQVIHSYEFKEFDRVSVELRGEGDRVSVKSFDLEFFRKNKKRLSDILIMEHTSRQVLAGN